MPTTIKGPFIYFEFLNLNVLLSATKFLRGGLKEVLSARSIGWFSLEVIYAVLDCLV